jgi:hypothetical protein
MKTNRSLSSQNDSEEKSRNPFGGLADFFSNLDDVADDFFYKRMGKGYVREILF